MNSMSVVGLFQGKEKPHKIENSLRIAGFPESHILTEEKNSDVFLLSVFAKDEYDHKMAQNILQYYNPYHTYTFNFQIRDVQQMRDLVNASAKTEIHSAPEINTHDHYHEGMNSEVVF